MVKKYFSGTDQKTPDPISAKQIEHELNVGAYLNNAKSFDFSFLFKSDIYIRWIGHFRYDAQFFYSRVGPQAGGAGEDLPRVGGGF